jgi:hypothetical protein
MAKESSGKAGRKTEKGEMGKQGGKGKKQKNPAIKEARHAFTEELRKQGVPEDQMKEKVKEHIKSVVRPVMTEAKTAAKAQNLKGPERKKFMQETVRTKLGLPA